MVNKEFRAKLVDIEKIGDKYGRAELNFVEAFSAMERILGMEPNVFEREKVRRTVESQSGSAKDNLLLEFSRYRQRYVAVVVKTGKVEKEREEHVEDLTAQAVVRLEGVLDFLEFLNKDFPKLAEEVDPALKAYLEHKKAGAKTELDNIFDESDHKTNQIQADSFDGVSEFTPDTVEELLGEVENN